MYGAKNKKKKGGDLGSPFPQNFGVAGKFCFGRNFLFAHKNTYYI